MPSHDAAELKELFHEAARTYMEMFRRLVPVVRSLEASQDDLIAKQRIQNRKIRMTVAGLILSALGIISCTIIRIVDMVYCSP